MRQILIRDAVGIVIHLERGKLGDDVLDGGNACLAQRRNQPVHGEIQGEVHAVTQLHLDGAIAAGGKMQVLMQHDSAFFHAGPMR